METKEFNFKGARVNGFLMLFLLLLLLGVDVWLFTQPLWGILTGAFLSVVGAERGSCDDLLW